MNPRGEWAPAEDEVLDTGRTPRGPARTRVLIAAALVALAGVVTGLVIAQNSGHSGDRADPRPSASDPQRPSPAPPVLPSAVGTFDVSGARYDEAVAVAAGGSIYSIRSGALYQQQITGPGITVAGLGRPGASDVVYQLALDPQRHRLWVAAVATTGTTLFAYDTDGLTRIGTVAVPGRAAGLAVLDSALYVGSDRGVFEVSDLPTVRRISARSVASIAADPTRHRVVLVLTGGGATRLGVQAGSGPVSVSTASVPFGKGTLFVVGGHVWAAGYGPRAVLSELDARSLAPTRASPLAATLGPGAELAAAGTRDFLVRSGGGDGLWCVDGATGEVLQSWRNLPGTVVVTPPDAAGAANTYVLPVGAATPLSLTGPRCPG